MPAIMEAEKLPVYRANISSSICEGRGAFDISNSEQPAGVSSGMKGDGAEGALPNAGGAVLDCPLRAHSLSPYFRRRAT